VSFLALEVTEQEEKRHGILMRICVAQVTAISYQVIPNELIPYSLELDGSQETLEKK
jgi:hypothetical protein